MSAKIDAGFSNLLNFCRWMSAFLVVISHVRNMVFPDKGGLDPRDPVSALFYGVTGFGHEAVILFFVMSGYLVGGTALADFRAGRFSPGAYFIARVSRIYTVFLPALLLVLVLDFTGSALFASSGFYTHPPDLHSLSFSIVERLDAVTLAGNLAMLQTILVEPFGSDVPLWSLANEWWYYLLFGGALWALKGRSRYRQVLSATAIAAVTVLLFPRQISLWFLIWASGAALVGIAPRRKIPLWFSVPLFLASLGLSRIFHLVQAKLPAFLPADFLQDLMVGLGFCLFLLSARQTGGLSLAGKKMNAFLADFSYSVYLFHFPLLIFFGALADRISPQTLPGQTGWRGGLCFCLGVALLYLTAFCLSRLTEANTARVRSVLRSLLTPHQAVETGGVTADQFLGHPLDRHGEIILHERSGAPLGKGDPSSDAR